MTVGLVTAFLGGALALLSPCAALLLPAFFAAKVSSARGQLLMHAAVFYVGLVTVLVPVGIGVGAIGVFFAKHRAEAVAVTAVVLIVLGVAQAFGKGFDIADAVPGLRSLQASGARLRGLPQSFVLGAAGAALEEGGIAGVGLDAADETRVDLEVIETDFMQLSNLAELVAEMLKTDMAPADLELATDRTERFEMLERACFCEIEP